MSSVTTWMLNVPYFAMERGVAGDVPHDLIDKWLRQGGTTWSPTTMRGHLSNAQEWGGGKGPQCNLIAAAINYFDLEAFRQFLVSLPWSQEGRENLQLFVMGEWDNRFEVWQLSPESNWRIWTQVA